MKNSLRQYAVIVAITLGALFTDQVFAADSSPAQIDADEAAIKVIIDRWDNGWARFDAALASQDYADDADWTNAFGLSRKGRAEIHQFLERIYKSPQITPRRSTPSKSTIRFPRTDIAVVASYRETVGQKTQGGDVYPTRKTRDLRILARLPVTAGADGGRWVIVSHLIADEKEVRP